MTGITGRDVRRVVTGHDGAGRAVVVSDGRAPFVHRIPGEPDFCSTDIWRSFATPAPLTATPEEPTLGPRRQLPASHGTVLRINRFPPESETAVRMSAEDSTRHFASLGNARAGTLSARHPMMHRTETLDYAIVLSGEITMLLDDEDVDLKAGDVVVQCGTNHAWANRSKEACVIAFILIDGEIDPELRDKLANHHDEGSP